MTHASHPTSQHPQAERFLLQLGCALHRYGTPSDEIEDTFGRLCARLGLRAHALITPTSLTVQFGEGPGPIYLVRSNQGEVNLSALVQLGRVTDSVAAGVLSYTEAQAQIAAIMIAPPPYAPLITLLGYAAASGAVAQILGGTPTDRAVAALVGLVMGLLMYAAARLASLARIIDFVAPAVAAALACSLGALIGPFAARLATLAGLIILLPGMAATTALSELARGHLVAGTARLMGAGVTFMKLGFGVALGTQLAHLVCAPVMTPTLSGPTWTQWPALGVAAVAVAVVLQAELRDIAWILCCALVGFVGLQMGARTLDSELAPCVAAFCVTCLSNVYARMLGRTASVTQVPAMLLLVPGTVGYRSVAALMQNDVLGGMQAAFTMGLDAMALVAGALVAGLLLAPRKDV